eukprot:gene919-229_t
MKRSAPSPSSSASAKPAAKKGRPKKGEIRVPKAPKEVKIKKETSASSTKARSLLDDSSLEDGAVFGLRAQIKKGRPKKGEEGQKPKVVGGYEDTPFEYTPPDAFVIPEWSAVDTPLVGEKAKYGRMFVGTTGSNYSAPLTVEDEDLDGNVTGTKLFGDDQPKKVCHGTTGLKLEGRTVGSCTSKDAFIDVGGQVTAMDFSPWFAFMEAPKKPCSILAISCHPRSQPVHTVGNFEGKPAHGVIQLWRVISLDSTEVTTNLQRVIPHSGGTCWQLQWIRKSRTKDRLGLLLAVLGSGEVCIYSLLLKEFHGVTKNPLEKILSIKPNWQALPSPQRVFCSAVAASSVSTKSVSVLAGSMKGKAYVWRVSNDADKSKNVTEYATAVGEHVYPAWDVSWCPSGEPEVFCVAMLMGEVVIWNRRRPEAPIMSVHPGGHRVTNEIHWVAETVLLIAQEAGILFDLVTNKKSWVRDRGDYCQPCKSVCVDGTYITSIWGDGVVCLKDCTPMKKSCPIAEIFSWRLTDYPLKPVYDLKTQREDLLISAFARGQGSYLKGFRFWEADEKAVAPENARLKVIRTSNSPIWDKKGSVGSPTGSGASSPAPSSPSPDPSRSPTHPSRSPTSTLRSASVRSSIKSTPESYKRPLNKDETAVPLNMVRCIASPNTVCNFTAVASVSGLVHLFATPRPGQEW